MNNSSYNNNKDGSDLNTDKIDKSNSTNKLSDNTDDMTNIKPIHSVTDNQITDDTLIYFYKGNPVYLDFLHINDPFTAEYFEKMKSNLTLRKWSSMKEKDKIYYIYNKIQYYNNLITVKEDSKLKYEKLIENKNKEIKNLQVMIYEKEMQHEKSGSNSQIDIMSK